MGLLPQGDMRMRRTLPPVSYTRRTDPGVKRYSTLLVPVRQDQRHRTGAGRTPGETAGTPMRIAKAAPSHVSVGAHVPVYADGAGSASITHPDAFPHRQGLERRTVNGYPGAVYTDEVPPTRPDLFGRQHPLCNIVRWKRVDERQDRISRLLGNDPDQIPNTHHAQTLPNTQVPVTTRSAGTSGRQ